MRLHLGLGVVDVSNSACYKTTRALLNTVNPLTLTLKLTTMLTQLVVAGALLQSSLVLADAPAVKVSLPHQRESSTHDIGLELCSQRILRRTVPGRRLGVKMVSF